MDNCCSRIATQFINVKHNTVFTAGVCEEEEELHHFDSYRCKNDSRTRIEGGEKCVLPVPFICSKEATDC